MPAATVSAVMPAATVSAVMPAATASVVKGHRLNLLYLAVAPSRLGRPLVLGDSNK